MSIEDLKQKITGLAQKHASASDELEDSWNFESIESSAEDLIIEYCEEMGYQVNGFPHEMRKLPEEELDEDYFCQERFWVYLDTLSLNHDDVADLMWHFSSSFWPDKFENKEEYLETIKGQLDCGVYYSVTL